MAPFDAAVTRNIFLATKRILNKFARTRPEPRAGFLASRFGSSRQLPNGQSCSSTCCLHSCKTNLTGRTGRPVAPDCIRALAQRHLRKFYLTTKRR